MGVIATFAGKVFQVDSKKIYTFSDFSYTSTLQTEKQDADGSKPSTYIKGPDLDKLSIKIKLDASWGVNPRNEWGAWKRILEERKAYKFILGGVPINNTNWLLTSVSPSNVVINGSGMILSLELELQFEEYIRPGSKKESSSSSVKSTSGGKSSISVPGLVDLLEKQTYSMPDNSDLKRKNAQMVAQAKSRNWTYSVY
ncbi:phage tail protein [Clostridium thermosuccinogenes]|uniref:phage tail protein n=1 Tax=Clostridium thermosuccinogenes TaxID=84032 RepID=UPI000CCC0E9D|nr:phage tail protein [Pseudoclostridium thermosuccinogenes]PNT91295.1 hypothetical protein CDQ83_15955 [Pseudoclostridium thermosuccinogenes]